MKTTRLNNFGNAILILMILIISAGTSLALEPLSNINNTISYNLEKGKVSISYLSIHNPNDQEDHLKLENVQAAYFDLSRNMKVNGTHINKGNYEVSLIELNDGLGFNFHSLDYKKQADIQVALIGESSDYNEFLNYSLKMIENDKIEGQINWKENKYTFSMEIALSNSIFYSLENKENEKTCCWMDYYQVALYAYKNQIDLEKSYEWAQKAMKLDQNEYTLSLNKMYIEKLNENAQQFTSLQN